ncbi:hypothetical protein FND55_10095 [Lactobacillus paracasei subsp. paracasei]|uniref:hypothetical protein n=1 Tax=Lacticaseibacillus paracasei TaxID=1597 RepID=UPI0018C6B365|nr:hypothetical protein [Lacticaseibacillus paracasei]MBG1273957.1 hypothetical protein [Lacticaseibacillus paracasei subsp. paracasei]
MMNETKRDVFEDAIDALADAQASGGNIGHQDANLFMAEYEAALPDDLPVIPQTVGEILQSAHVQDNLLGVLDTAKNGYKLSETLAWIIANQNTFARAWLLGVWRVEGTGEIVKLEAEK